MRLRNGLVAKTDGSFNFDGTVVSFQQVTSRYAALRGKFHSIGVKDVSLWLVVEQPRGIEGTHIQLTQMVNELESLDDWNKKAFRP
jgi:hypothetical protein